MTRSTMRTKKRGGRRLAVITAEVATLTLALLTPTTPATAAEVCNKVQTVRVAGSTAYTQFYYSVAKSGTQTETARATSSPAEGYLEFSVTTCKNPTTGWYARDVIELQALHLQNLDTTISGGKETYKPTNGSVGYGFMAGPQTSGPGKRVLSFVGLECRSRYFGTPWTIAYTVFDMVPLKIGTVLESVVKQTVTAWATNYIPAAGYTGYSCGKPQDDFPATVVMGKITLSVNTAGTVSVGSSATMAYNRYVSTPTLCVSTLGISVIDCGYHYRTYITLTPSKV